MALNLRALTASGIENIALMTDKQRTLAVAAKVGNLRANATGYGSVLTSPVRMLQKSTSSSN